MAATAEATRLNARPRTSEGSRATRRLRREGRIPGVLYGGTGEPVAFDVDARELRHALAASGAVLELAIDGETAPAVLKDTQRHPVRGEVMHVDLLRVDLTVAIHATVVIDLVGVESAPGVVEGGVLEQVTREVHIEALPGDIPESIQHDVSGLELNATEYLSAIVAPRGVTILDDPEETVIASITAPSVEEPAEGEIEQETERVGEAGAEAAAEGEEPAADAPAPSDAPSE